MSDEIKITDDWADWLSQKKSEFLAWLIQHQPIGEIELEKFADFYVFLPELLSKPVEKYSYQLENKKMHTFVGFFQTEIKFWLVSITVEIPHETEVIVFPILTIPCHDLSWTQEWMRGKNQKEIH